MRLMYRGLEFGKVKGDIGMKKFVLENNFYWEVIGDYAYNPYGGRHQVDETLPMFEAEDITDLDWSFLIDKDSKFGWITPQGDFYPCAPYNHANVAEYIFKMSQRECEQRGYIKIYERSWGSGIGVWVNGFTTEAQNNWLRANGLEKWIREE